MATKFVLDTSVAIKWFFREKETYLEEAHKLLNDINNQKIEILTLDFLLVEFTSALLKSKRTDIQTSIASCKILLQSPIKFSPLTSVILFDATRLTSTYSVTIYDALYLALAIQEDTQVITADKVMGKIKKYSLFISEYR